MKAICINDNAWADFKDGVRWQPLKVGAVYTVSQSPDHEDSYVVAEISPPYPFIESVDFKKHLFAPLSDLDETVIHAEHFQTEPLNA